MKRFFTVISLIPFLLTGWLWYTDGGTALFHLIWLITAAGGIAGVLTSPVLFAVHLGVSFVSITAAHLINNNGFYTAGIFTVLFFSALLDLLGFGIGAFVMGMFQGSLPRRIGAGLAAAVLLAVLLVPVNAFFGNPVSALRAKHQLDSCMEAHIDPERYTAVEFAYDWYDGQYFYRLRDTVTGEMKNLTLYKKTDKIYFSGTNRTYDNLWN